jgi:beta-phosphoglucomutase
MISGIAFDLEGTLINVEPAHHQAHLAVASDLGLRLTIDEAMKTFPSFIGGPDIQVLREIAAKASYRGSLSSIHKQKIRYYNEFLETIPIQPRPGVIPVLEYIQNKGILKAIGSVTPRNEGLRLMRLASLTNYFSERNMVFAEDVEDVKPNPAVYKTTASRMNILPREQLVFEDSPQGVKAGVAASSIVVAVPTVKSQAFASMLLAAGARKVVKSWQRIDLPSLFSELNNNS